jgi:hypothetical protein
MKKIELDGTPHNILFNFNTLINYKELSGKDALSMKNLDYSDFRLLAYEGIKEAARFNGDEFKMTIEQVGGHLNTAAVTQLTEALLHDMGGSSEKK